MSDPPPVLGYVEAPTDATDGRGWAAAAVLGLLLAVLSLAVNAAATVGGAQLAGQVRREMAAAAPPRSLTAAEATKIVAAVGPLTSPQRATLAGRLQTPGQWLVDAGRQHPPRVVAVDDGSVIVSRFDYLNSDEVTIDPAGRVAAETRVVCTDDARTWTVTDAAGTTHVTVESFDSGHRFGPAVRLAAAVALALVGAANAALAVLLLIVVTRMVRRSTRVDRLARRWAKLKLAGVAVGTGAAAAAVVTDHAVRPWTGDDSLALLALTVATVAACVYPLVLLAALNRRSLESQPVVPSIE